MSIIELPCGIGDTIYYITAWDKHGIQEDHEEIINKITIMEGETVFHTESGVFALGNYKETWFTDKEEWEKECEILRETYRYEQQLRQKASKGALNE